MHVFKGDLESLIMLKVNLNLYKETFLNGFLFIIIFILF